ncbi:MAG: PilZ domain-containing protein [Erythrobacter sp.]
MLDSSAEGTGAALGGTETHYSRAASLLLRRAKVVCEHGEYLCLIRDVSELGVGLGFLHDVPPEKRVLLQLANDLTYPVERIWTGKRQAGYRFGGEVTVESFLREQTPHKPRALRLTIPGTVRIDEGRSHTDARLLDISCEGAKIASPAVYFKNRLLSFHLEGLPTQLVQVRWSDNGRHGLRFQNPLDTEELALCALHLQPFNGNRSSGFNRLLAKARAA